MTQAEAIKEFDRQAIRAAATFAHLVAVGQIVIPYAIEVARDYEAALARMNNFHAENKARDAIAKAANK